MSTIKESIDTLSEKLGVTEREQTIKDQLDLCVERLGGEGNSKDIAESAEKFAEKEDGTATFMTKNITENNTYNAADDGVSGYSSVTVNVSGGASEFIATITVEISDNMSIVCDKTYSEVITAINNGDFVKFYISGLDEEPYIALGFINYPDEALLITYAGEYQSHTLTGLSMFEFKSDNTITIKQLAPQA